MLLKGILFFILGLVIGSFLNAAIYRLRHGKSLVKTRSFCPNCKHPLGFWDLIPLFSFIFLKGKCRYCGEKISLQYPLVELLTGSLFLFVFLTVGVSNLLYITYLLIVFSFLVVILVYDLKYKLVPSVLIYIITLLSLVWRWQQTSSWQHLETFIISGVTAAAFFFLLWFISRGKWMGLGDGELALFVGIFLGWPKVLVGLFLSFLIGAIIGIALCSFGNKTLQSQVPFAPFLIIGTFIAFFWGNQILQWYLSFL